MGIVEQITEEKQELLNDINNLKQRNYELDGLFKASEEDKDNLQKLVSDMRSRVTDLESEIETIQRNFENEARSLKSKITKLESASKMFTGYPVNSTYCTLPAIEAGKRT